MARQKVPVRAKFRMLEYSPSHTFPFHLVGTIEDQERHVVIGITQEQAQDTFKKLYKVFKEQGIVPDGQGVTPAA